MAVSLTKGGNVSLTKQAPGLSKISVGLGWEARTASGSAFDLDASAILAGPDGRVPSDSYFVFYSNRTSPDSSVRHQGDNRTGIGEGDDEVIDVDLDQVAPQVDRVVFAVSIYDGDTSGHTFGQVRNAYIRVLDRDTRAEVARYALSEDASDETAMVYGELYRNGQEWKFRAVGQGHASGLRGIAEDFGVSV